MKTIKVRFPIAVSGTAWSAQGWSNNSGRTPHDQHTDAMATSAREAIYDTVGSDPNVMVVHWIEVEIPVAESETIKGKEVPAPVSCRHPVSGISPCDIAGCLVCGRSGSL